MRTRPLVAALALLLVFANVALAAPASRQAEHAGVASQSAPAGGCTFVLGFAHLREVVGPDTVGDCLSQQFATDDGARQATTQGVLIWRSADNWTGFTNGRFTWWLAADGVRKRPNGQAAAGPDAAVAMNGDFAAIPDSGPLLPGRRIVTYYGNPLSSAMGVLGEDTPQAMIARLKQQARDYADADPSTPVLPGLELVATVAQAGPGADGKYRLRMDDEVIDEVAGWAEDNGFILILDVQIGYSTVPAEVEALIPWLKRPHVHLALDPEFAMRPGEPPGTAIGTLDAQQVNWTVQRLNELVEQEHIPPKLLIVHRFTDQMVTNAAQIRSTDRVQVALVMDGFGPPATKQATWDRDIAPVPVQFTGIKLFYQQDHPLFTPEQALEFQPTPSIIIYQ